MSLPRHIIEPYFVKCLLVAGILLQSTQIEVSAKPIVNFNEKDLYVTVDAEHIWNKNHITWCLRNRWIKNTNVNDVKQVLNKAFSIWSDESTLTFDEADCAVADFHVSFEKNFHACSLHFGPERYQKSHSFPPSSHRAGDIHFLDGENWILFNEKEHSTNGIDLMSTALYEIGRALGLNTASTIMYHENGQKIHDDDIRQIQKLYGSPKIDYEDGDIIEIDFIEFTNK